MKKMQMAVVIGLMSFVFVLPTNAEESTEAIQASETETMQAAGAEAVTPGRLSGTWKGYYTGSDGEKTVEREYSMSINKEEDGEIAGVAYIQDGEDGTYYFSGYADEETGEVSWYGDDWYQNPNGFGFTEFEGVFDPKTGRIEGITEYDDSRPFALDKVSDQYEITAISREDIPREWIGEYDGHTDGRVTRRNLQVTVESIDEEGNIKAKVYFSPSDIADINDSYFGYYYANGTVDYASSKVFMQGYEWIWYPVPAAEGNSSGNWEFVELNGRINAGDGSISGYTEDGIWEMSAPETEANPIAAQLIGNIETGDRIGFGSYDTDGWEDDQESVQWIILDKQDTKVLIISSQVIDAIPFNSEYTDSDWESSSIREWLNGEFLSDHFSDAQKAMILETELDNPSNSAYEGKDGSSTTDSVFLLSEEEVNEYLTAEDRVALLTGSTADRMLLSGKKDYDETGAWLLRTNGASSDLAAFVDPEGEVNLEGVPVNSKYIGLRPAMWIDLDAGE